MKFCCLEVNGWNQRNDALITCMIIWKLQRARCQWLIPIILDTQEADIRRITVCSQPGQNVRDPISKIYSTKWGW
jgi:hypothetical protein